MKIFSIGESIDSILFVWRKPVNENAKLKFRRKLGYRDGTYAAKLMDRIQSVIFDFGENISETYAQLFSKEYEKLEDYLHKELIIECETVQGMMIAQKKNESLYMLDISCYDSYRLRGLFDSGGEFPLVEKLNKALEGV